MSDAPALQWINRSHSFANALLDPDVDIPQGIGAKDNDDVAPKRFSVYRNNVVVSLMEALAATYSSTKALLGDANFDQISRAYVALHPPKSAMMQIYGQDFSTFVRDLPALSELPFLADLACVEWAWNEATHARDEIPLESDDLAGLSPEQSLAMTLTPARATSLIRSPWCIHTMFQCRYDGLADDVDFDDPQNVLITRKDLEVQAILLPDDDAICLQALCDGQNFGEAVGAAMAVNATYNPAHLIALCLQAQVFTSNSNKSL